MGGCGEDEVVVVMNMIACINNDNHKWIITYDNNERVCERCGVVDQEYTKEMNAIYMAKARKDRDDNDYDHNGLITPFDHKMTLGSYGTPYRLRKYNQVIKYRSRDVLRYRLIRILVERFSIFGLTLDQITQYLREIKKEDEREFKFKRGLREKVIKHLKERGINKYEGMTIEEYITLLFDVNLESNAKNNKNKNNDKGKNNDKDKNNDKGIIYQNNGKSSTINQRNDKSSIITTSNKGYKYPK